MSEPIVITPERIVTEEGRFGIRSSRVNTSSSDVTAFLNALASRGFGPNQATQPGGMPAMTSAGSDMSAFLGTLASQAYLSSQGMQQGGTPFLTSAPSFPTALMPQPVTFPGWPAPVTSAPAVLPDSVTSRPISGVPYSDLITAAAQRYGVDPALVAGVIQVESGFDPSVVSHVGAKGLMQLMDETAQILGVTDSFDPAQNIDGGVRFLRDMLDRFDGDVSLALAAYNAGPYAVEEYGGIPPYEETQAYVPRVIEYYQQFAGMA